MGDLTLASEAGGPRLERIGRADQCRDLKSPPGIGLECRGSCLCLRTFEKSLRPGRGCASPTLTPLAQELLARLLFDGLPSSILNLDLEGLGTLTRGRMKIKQQSENV